MKKLLLFLFLILAPLAFFAGSVSAKVVASQTENITIAQDEVVDDDLFIGGQTVNIDGVVNGDVFVGGQMVRITGTINGNLHVGGNMVDLQGIVKGNVYAGGQTITLSGAKVGGSVLAGGATVSIDKTSTIGGSLMAGAGTLGVDSQIKRSVYAGSGNLRIGDNTVVGKDLYYAFGNGQQVTISEKAVVTGAVYKHESISNEERANFENSKAKAPAVFRTFKLFSALISFAGALLVGFLYFKLFGNHFTKTADLVTKSFWKVLGIGFLVTIALIPGLIVLLITVVGAPLAGLSLLVFMFFSYLSKLVVGLALGRWIAQKLTWKFTDLANLAVGLLVIYLVKMIVFVGFLSGLAVFWAGLGALVLPIFTKSE